MSVSTISGSIGNFITLGSGSYANDLTITSTGTVGSGSFEGDGPGDGAQLTVEQATSRLLNDGGIAGGSEVFGGTSGGLTGLDLSAGYVRNNGGISGGSGEGRVYGVLQSGGTLANYGSISGGAWSAEGVAPGSYYDFGVKLTQGSLLNAGQIVGGSGAAGLDLTGGSAVNSGTIIGGYYNGLSSYVYGRGVSMSGGSLLNLGTILGQGGLRPHTGFVQAVQVSGGTFDNAGYTDGLIEGTSGTVINSGTIVRGAALQGPISGTTPASAVLLINSGTVTGGVTASGTLNQGVVNSGTITGGVKFAAGNAGLTLAPGAVVGGAVSAVESFTMTVFGSVSSGISPATIVTVTDINQIELEAGSVAGSINLGGSFSGFNSIVFDSGASWVLGGTAAELAAGQSITGFDLGDTLVLDGFSASSHEFAGGELTLSNATESLTLDLSGSFSGLIVTDVAQGAEIAVCYLRGTPILTPDGECAIEALRIGDAVVTRFGGVRRIKWIGEQRYAGRFLQGNAEMLPVRIAAGALGQGVPVRELIVSPGHSLLLDGQLVLAQYLVNGITVTQGEVPDEVHYFNIELEVHDCLLAAGVWAESYAECAATRNKFHNAADFSARYPEHVAPLEPVLCAPRPMAGAALAGALAPVMARAAAFASPGPLRGFIDILTPDGRIEGWAQDVSNPELPVWLEVSREGEIIARVLACEMRPDLRAAGLGSGRHAFKVTIPGGAGTIEIRRAADGAVLALTEAAKAA